MKIILNLFTALKKIFVGYVTPPCVGIDIASTAIKMVELKRGSLTINRYKIASLEKNAVSEGTINNIDVVSEIVRTEWENLKSDYQEVAIAIPYNSVIIKEIKAPLFKSRHQLDSFVFESLIKELDTEDIDFDYTITSQTSEDQLLSVVVARKEKIEEYQAIIQMTGMSVAAIDIEPFAIQYLFTLLLKKSKMETPFLIFDIGATRIRVYVLFEQSLVSFNEISVNYSSFLEEIITSDPNALNLAKIDSVCDYVFEQTSATKYNFKKLADAIIYDVAKLIQLVKSNVLVERKMNLADDLDLYFIGGNALIPGVIENFKLNSSGKVFVGSELLANSNPNLSQIEIMRLFTTIALATWGQNFDKN